MRIESGNAPELETLLGHIEFFYSDACIMLSSVTESNATIVCACDDGRVLMEVLNTVRLMFASVSVSFSGKFGTACIEMSVEIDTRLKNED